MKAGIAYSTARAYLAVLCENGFVTVIGKGSNRLIYPVNKEGKPMHPQESAAPPVPINGTFEADNRHSEPACPPTQAPVPSSSEFESSRAETLTLRLAPKNRRQRASRRRCGSSSTGGDAEQLPETDPIYLELAVMTNAQL